ncbi:J domain-containing protein [Novosphingobium album (ex Liu et al. 2023)]|uniref:J domain-containing protein n=1 Tax=Novosphingobium album (ex Liu et al. 2023) TaxID=3031130 RepID=A0ABT5WLD4_9SPHN|nr:J domain-containing protein [Novosphingobium album (ex Liu et al. 2023)]MDE8650853.1 J domain-containing protein [Novosphingobium album (ex Liu et al. 2023)]
MKLVWLLLLAVAAWRLIVGRWPWQRKPARHGAFERAGARALLGVGEGASRKEILEAHRRVIATVHPDRGGSSEKVHEANTARDILLADLFPDS